jgi:hypothetical protein
MVEQYEVPEKTSLSKQKLYLTLFSGLVFLSSLTQIAIASNDLEDRTLSGLAVLLMGGTVVLGGGLLEWLIWLANPLYFVSIYLLIKGNSKAKATSIIATFVALSFSTWDNILVSTSGRTGKIDTLGTGYWLWVSSLVIFTVGALYIFRKIKVSTT